VKLRRFPGPVLPIAGGTLFAALIADWYTSAYWLYTRPTPVAGSAVSGAQVFASSGCGDCHTLAAANATGAIGPNLDALRPTVAQVQAKVEQGGGVMPSFRNRLTAEQIRAVAEFVASRAGLP
jgi:mono/diheme cytochrome c family protein